MRYSEKQGRSQLKTDTKPAATLLSLRNVARNLFKTNLEPLGEGLAIAGNTFLVCVDHHGIRKDESDHVLSVGLTRGRQPASLLIP